MARLGARARVSRQAVTKHLEVRAARASRDSWQRRERIWEIERKRFGKAHVGGLLLLWATAPALTAAVEMEQARGREGWKSTAS